MRHLASAISLAAGLSIAAAASASAAVLGPVKVSGPTPYAACTSQDAGQTGRNFLNGEEEPQLAVNPANPADPVHAGVAYTVWDTSISPTDNPDDRIHAAAYVGPAYFSKTTDGGTTWSSPRVIIGPGNRHQTIGNIVVVDPRNDDLYDFT